MHTVRKPSSSRLSRIRPIAFSLFALATAQLALGQATAPATTAPVEATTTDAPKKDDLVVLETFRVTGGFSGSLAAAAEAKEKNQAIVEVIMAEDIGKLPDVSIADSLTRLTGVAAQRQNGRAQSISIRGLTGDFVTTMLNGREQVSTGSARGVEFDQYPAELLNAVVVYKTAGANLTSQGIAGSVDLITVQPLSKTGRSISLNAYYKTTELGMLTPGVEENGNSFSVAYMDQFDDGKVGIALGYAHTLTPFQGQQFQAWGYGIDGAGNYQMTGTKSYVRSSNLTRDGFMGVLEFKPSDNIHSTIDVYYSKFEENQVLRGMEIPLFPDWTGTVLQPGFTASGGYLDKGVYANVHPVVRNDSFIRNDDLFAAGWNLVIGKNSEWPVVFDMGYSKIERTDKNLELWSGLYFNRGGTGDTMTVQMTNGGIPVITKGLDYSNAALLKLTDPAGWQSPATQARPGYYKGFESKDELGQFKLFTKHELKNFFSSVEVGVSYTERFKRDGEQPSGFETLQPGQTAVALPATIGTTDMSFLGITGGIAAFDPFAAANDGTLFFVPNNDTGVIANRWSVTEKITRPYVQFNIDSKWGNVPVTGNVGLQWNMVDQSSSGKSASGSTVNNVTDGDKYNDLSPSLNLNFKVAERSYIRLGLARQIARPRMFDMKASRTWSYNPGNAGSSSLQNSPWSGSGGNPSLQPWISDSIDLSFDKYFKDNMGYFSLALFNKDLKNYIYQAQSQQDFTGYPIPAGGPEPVLREGTVTTPVNGEGGSIKGMEATLSLSSELLTNRAVKGLGLIMGFAYTDSSVKPWGPTSGDSPINGLSEKVGNITVYYERGGFSARVSQHYRSEYRASVTNFGAPNPGGDINPNGGYSTTQPETQLDAQISYALQSTRAKGLTFYLQAYNLTNEPLVTFDQGDSRRVINYQTYGASYNLGASYKF